MDLGAPYRAVVPSLDGPVLRALAATSRPLTGLEVHRLARAGSDSGVRKVLARLVEHGLVKVAEAGPSLLYEANRDHLAWLAVQALVSIRPRLLDALRHLVATWRVPPVLVGLFGSAARGDGHTGSDIDLLVIRPDQIGDAQEAGSDDVAQQWARQVSALRQAATAMTGNHTQIVELSASALAQAVDSGEAIVESWRRDLLVLAGHTPWVRPLPATQSGADPAASPVAAVDAVAKG